MEISKKTIFTLNDLRSAFCENDCAYPTPLSAELYDRAAAEGFDMIGYYTRLPSPTNKVRVTIYNAAGEIVVDEMTECHTATQEQIDDMVSLIQSGCPARDAAALVMESQ